MRRKRQVKEGSPYEEENLIEMLREEVVLSSDDKNQVKEVINALVYFQMITQSINLHKLVENLMRAQNKCTGLFSVEQERILTQQPDLKTYFFSEQLGSINTDLKFTEALAEWENLKFFKH